MHEQSLKLLRSLVPAINKISETLTAMEERYDSKISSLEVNVSTLTRMVEQCQPEPGRNGGGGGLFANNNNHVSSEVMVSSIRQINSVESFTTFLSGTAGFDSIVSILLLAYPDITEML